MAHLTIDQEKCIKCNRCVTDCPMGIPARMADGTYGSAEENAQVCIYCGHCVAVCPAGAVTLNSPEDEAVRKVTDDYGIVPFSLSREECARTELDRIPKAQEVEALIRSRRMTRSFKKKPVDHGTVEHMVHDVLTYTPTGHNNRGYKAIVVEGREKLDRLTSLSLEYFQELVDAGSLHQFDEWVYTRMIEAWKKGIDRVFRTANEAIVIHCKSSIVPADPAVKVMLTYFEMLANSMGLGTVWAGYFMVAANYPPIKEMLGVPEDETIYGAMMFGYPEFTYEYIPKRPEIGLRYV